MTPRLSSSRCSLEALGPFLDGRRLAGLGFPEYRTCVGLVPESIDPSGRARLGRDLERAVYAIALLLAAAALYKARPFYEDDAFITLRYAKRWIEGHGPTWTDGERVQGYTHPLWLLQLALLGRLGADLTLASRALGVAYFAAIFAVFKRSRALPTSALVLATLPGLSAWALGGLETVSFAFWLVLVAWLAETAVRENGRGAKSGAFCGAALAAAALTRPEGAAVAFVVAAWLVRARRWQALGGLAAAFLAPCAAWEICSAVYYGDLLPNPAYSKITGYPILQSMRDGLAYLTVASSSWLWATSASIVGLAIVRRSESTWLVAMAMPVVLGLLLGGGDHMVGGRLILPAVVLVVYAVGRYARDTHGWTIPALLVAASLLDATVALAEPRRPDRAAVLGEKVGRFLEKNLPSGSLVAISVAGSTAYFAPSLRFIDTLGLCDRHIARRDVPVGVTAWQSMAGHRKGDGDYVLSRSPDVILLGAASGFLGLDAREWFLTDYELLKSDTFRRTYRPFSFRLEDGNAGESASLHMTAYLRKGSSAADALAPVGVRLPGPWYVDSRVLAAASTGVAFQSR
jgi:arabinofuranosyltransferase